MDPTVPAWKTDLTPLNSSDQAFPEATDIVTLVLVFLDFFITLVGLAGNAVVLWLLGFCMKKNTFSIYVLNLAVADFLFLSLAVMDILKPGPAVQIAVWLPADSANQAVCHGHPHSAGLPPLRPALWH
ncbi:mas-related G-protein coupled receptor member X2-like [Talpa occidentalis]|uniref:mas-related G-protein coupled receptor member X2-like n=1 Tax=Talpa occidentalis TaxID=50954 RepID=UPI0018901FAD|nr:mas-related G-protein coupled receptor member X2-like [Talpa occidentalis]